MKAFINGFRVVINVEFLGFLAGICTLAAVVVGLSAGVIWVLHA